MKERQGLIDRQESDYSVSAQCQLLGMNRTTLYYKPVGISERDREMMNLLDEQYTRTPFYGVLRMRESLRNIGYEVGSDHVRTLLRKMGLFAVYPGPNLSQHHQGHKIYPYLLKGLTIKTPNHVWSADITYIRLNRGFAYLTAIIDWYSRCVLSWRLSNTLDHGFCIEALEEALKIYGEPEIFNSDQGSQFTSKDFTAKLEERKISISMDGKGRAHDNIFVERLWRSVKYENIYLHGYQDIPELREGLKRYFKFYNGERFHQSLDYRTPLQVYLGRDKTINSVREIDYRASASVLVGA